MSWLKPRAKRTPQNRCYSRPLLEVLEDRTLPSATLVQDINPGSASSNPSTLSDFNGTLLFAANNAVHGNELWKSDGTNSGTSLVRDFVDGPGSSNPTGGIGKGGLPPFVTLNGSSYFLANNTTTSEGIYKTQGTEATTELVRIFTGISAVSWLTAFQGKLLFVAVDMYGQSLWSSDGTDSGTMPLASASAPQQLTAVGNTLFFSAGDAAHGQELWSSDGTSSGTKLLKDIVPGTGSSSPDNFTVFNDKLYFMANTGGFRQLWVSDGTDAGTHSLTNFTDRDSLTNLIAFTNALYFIGQFTGPNETILDTALWTSDGTAAGTKKVVSLTQPTGLMGASGHLYFTDTDTTHGRELWTSDGTAAGTHLVKDLASGTTSSNPAWLTAFNNKVYFAATDSAGKRQLWFSDGTDAGTAIEPITSTNSVGPNPNNLTLSNGNLFFSINDGVHGNELWVLPGAVQQSPLPSLSINNATAKEGENAVFTVRLSAASDKQVTVQYFTSYSTAVINDDYDPIAPTTLTFQPGEITKTISVTTHQHLQYYDQGTFFVFLRNPANATVNVSQGTGTIVHTTKIDATLPSDFELFVRRLYLDFVGRVAESGGLAYWVGLLQGGASEASAVSGIMQSAEHLSYEVQQTYERFLQRPAEASGLTYWTSFLRNGGALESLQAGFLASPEYFQARGGNTAQSYLQAIYGDTLNRGLDPFGESYWGALLTGGQSRQRVAQAILDSAEATRQLVTSIYFQLIHHAPDAAGLAYWVGRLQTENLNGLPARSAATRAFPNDVATTQREMVLEELLQGLAVSIDYQVQFSASFLNQLWLGKLYGDMLGRPLDNLGRTVWLGQLASGISREQIVGEIETEPVYQEERKHQIDRLYHELLGRPDTTPTSPFEISDGLTRITDGNYDHLRAHIYGLDEFSPPDPLSPRVSNHEFIVRLLSSMYGHNNPLDQPLPSFDANGNPVPGTDAAFEAEFINGNEDREQFAFRHLDNASSGIFSTDDRGARLHYLRVFYNRFLGNAVTPVATEPVFAFVSIGSTGLPQPMNLPDPTCGGHPVYFVDLPCVEFAASGQNYVGNPNSIAGHYTRLSEEQFLANLLGTSEYWSRPCLP